LSEPLVNYIFFLVVYIQNCDKIGISIFNKTNCDSQIIQNRASLADSE